MEEQRECFICKTKSDLVRRWFEIHGETGVETYKYICMTCFNNDVDEQIYKDPEFVKRIIDGKPTRKDMIHPSYHWLQRNKEWINERYDFIINQLRKKTSKATD